MITVRKADERGHADHGWLRTWHTFSFADYQDSRHIRFRSLRVMNEDIVAAGQGFGTHPHRDMEIVTYILSGALEHRDSMGNGEVLHAGEFQRMSAGSGITHSEFNPSPDEPVHLYQIWLFPEQKGIAPSYEQKRFRVEDRRDRLQLVASREAERGSLRIHQDARIYLADLGTGSAATYVLSTNRHAWVQVLAGAASVNGVELEAGDGAALSDVAELLLQAGATGAELLLFDLA